MHRFRFWFFCAAGSIALSAVGIALALALLYPSLPPAVVAARPFRLLDGVRVTLGNEHTRIVGALIDGMVDGRPTVGLAQAPLVWEVPVEGGITRFLAVYPFDALPEKLGPIRSLRSYFFDFASEVGALLLHVGGSPEALARAQTFPLLRLDQFFDDRFFWRSTDRRAPHNVFTSRYLITQALTERQYAQESVFTSWRYRDEGVEVANMHGDGIRIVYATPPYTVEWRWNGVRYERSVGGVRHTDADGTAIDAENILVQFTVIEILDEIGRRRITTEGEGKALVLTAGSVHESTWKKESGSRTHFFDTSKPGVEVALTPGTTWIEVVPTKADVTLVPFSAILETSIKK